MLLLLLVVFGFGFGSGSERGSGCGWWLGRRTGIVVVIYKLVWTKGGCCCSLEGQGARWCLCRGLVEEEMVWVVC